MRDCPTTMVPPIPFSKESSSQISPSRYWSSSCWCPLWFRKARCLISLSFAGTFFELSYFWGGEVADTIYRLLVRLWTIGGEAIREKWAISGTVATVAIYCSVVCFPEYFKVGGLNTTCCYLAAAVAPVNELDIKGIELEKVLGVCKGNVDFYSSLETSSCKLTTNGCFTDFLFKFLRGFIISSTALVFNPFSSDWLGYLLSSFRCDYLGISTTFVIISYEGVGLLRRLWWSRLVD